jgi:hypothetical protein
VPLAINLDKRAQAEVETQALLHAQTIAEMVGAEHITPALAATAPLAQTKLQRFVYGKFAHTENGRVIVIDPEGTLIADSAGPGRSWARCSLPKHHGRRRGTATRWAKRSSSPQPL